MNIFPKNNSVSKLLSVELKLQDIHIVYVCQIQIAIFINFAIDFNVKALQLRDAITRKLYRKPVKDFIIIDVSSFGNTL